MTHHPTLYATRSRCWATCRCGTWRSRSYTTPSGAHIEFGEHLLAVAGVS